MGIKLPFIYQYKLYDLSGKESVVDISIIPTLDLRKYPPDGVKCVFKFFKEEMIGTGRYELLLLIDNHEPFGFHMHDRLPEVHDSRIKLPVGSWQEAWLIFDKVVKELLNEA